MQHSIWLRNTSCAIPKQTKSLCKNVEDQFNWIELRSSGWQPDDENMQRLIINLAVPQKILHILCIFLQVDGSIVHDDNLIMDKVAALDCLCEETHKTLRSTIVALDVVEATMVLLRVAGDHCKNIKCITKIT